MKKISLLCVIFLFLFIISAFAETSIKAEIDKSKVSTDENIIYKVTVTSTDKKLSSPKMPSFNGFNVLSQIESSSLSLGEKEIKTTLIYTFILAPINAGKFTIDSSSVKIKNSILSADKFEIEVTQAKAKPQAPPEPQPSFPGQGEDKSDGSRITL